MRGSSGSDKRNFSSRQAVPVSSAKQAHRWISYFPQEDRVVRLIERNYPAAISVYFFDDGQVFLHVRYNAATFQLTERFLNVAIALVEDSFLGPQ